MARASTGRDRTIAADAEQVSRAAAPRSRLAESIRFDDVGFSHGDARPLLDHASFSIPAQGLTVIVGPSGAGKTTLLDLVVGLHQPESGRILIDGVPLTEIDLRQWRRQIGYVPQESVMVDDSVSYNLALGEEGLGEAEIREALRAADALAFVEAMPELRRRGSAKAALAFPAGSGSGWRSPARWCTSRAC